MNHPLAQVHGHKHSEGPVGGLWVEDRARTRDQRLKGTEFPGSVHVPLHNVPAEWAARGGGQLKIDAGSGRERAQRGAFQGLMGQVSVEVIGVDIERGEADSRDGKRVALAQPRGNAGSLHGDAANAAAIDEADEGSGLLNDAGEHGFSVSELPHSLLPPMSPRP